MNRKFLITTVAALLLVCASPALIHAQTGTQDSGQTATAPRQKPAGPELNLTDDQKAQIKKIHQDTKAQIDAVQNDSSLSADQKQAKVRDLRKEAHKQREAVLTPDQRKMDREWHQAHKGQQQEQTPPSN
jgi:periplasmic protein CpxP/Spy